MLQGYENRARRLMLIVLALSLTACATNSPPPSVTCPAPPAMPSAATPQPSTTYSDSAREQLRKWRDKLTATPLTP